MIFIAALAGGGLWLTKKTGTPSQEVIILVANLDGPEDYKVTQAVLARMREGVQRTIQGVRVVPLGFKITEQEGPQKAQEEGRKAGANLVLWGYYNTSYRGQVHIEQIKAPKQLHLLKREYDLNPPAAERRGLTVEEDLSAELNYLVLLVSGLTRFEIGQYSAAIECYDQALRQRTAPAQLVDELDIYWQRGKAWLYLEEAESFYKQNSGKQSEGGAFYLGGDSFPLNTYPLDQAIANFTIIINAKPDDISALLERAFAHAKKGDYQQAIDDYNLILERDPNEAQGYSGRGIAYNLLKNYDQAIADYDVAEKLTQQKDAEVYYNRAISFENKDELQRALDDYNRALALEPSHADSKINRASVYARLGYLQLAERELDGALNGVLPSVFYYSRRGSAWVDIGNTDKALSDFGALINLEPSSPVGYHSRGHLLLELRRFDEAVGDFTKVIDIDPQAGYAYNDRATCRAFQRNYTEALNDFTVALRFEPNWGPSWVNQGLVHRNLKQYELAITDLTRAAEIDFEEKYLAYYYRGKIKSETGDDTGAINDYALAIKERPGHIDIWLDKATAWMKVKKYDTAVREYQTALSLEVALSEGIGTATRRDTYSTAIRDLTEALKSNSRNSEGYVARCLAHLLNDTLEEALQDINTAVSLNSTSEESYLFQGIILARLKRYEDAVKSFSQALKLKPQFVRALYYRGLAYCHEEQFASAIDDFSEAINLDSKYVRPRLERGRCYALQHDFQRAISDFESVPESSSDYDKALLLRGLAKVDMGHRQEAINDLRRAYYLAKAANIQTAAAAELVRLGAPVRAEGFPD